MAQFNLYLDALEPEFAALIDFFKCRGREVMCGRGETFLREGDAAQWLGFVESGYFKYIVRDGRDAERVVGFSFANDFVGDINAWLASKPSEVSVVAGRKSVVKVISMADFADFAMSQGLRYCMAIEVALFRTYYVRYLDMYRLSAKERYAKIVREHKELVQRVPLCELASYLGITPIHLSRLRRELHRE